MEIWKLDYEPTINMIIITRMFYLASCKDSSVPTKCSYLVWINKAIEAI